MTAPEDYLREWDLSRLAFEYRNGHGQEFLSMIVKELERRDNAVADEREGCAKILDDAATSAMNGYVGSTPEGRNILNAYILSLMNFAAEIRKRDNK